MQRTLPANITSENFKFAKAIEREFCKREEKFYFCDQVAYSWPDHDIYFIFFINAN